MKLPKAIAALSGRTGGTYLIIVPYYWGRGATLDEAYQNLRKEGGKLGKQFAVYWQPDVSPEDPNYPEKPPVDTRPYLDDYGAMCWWGSIRPEQLAAIRS